MSIIYAHTHHRHRLYGVLCIFHVLVFDQIANGNSYSTLWCYVVFVWNEKLQLWKLVCITKHLNMFVRNISIILNTIFPFCSLWFTCPSFVSDLINYSMFECHHRNVSLNFPCQTNIRCTGYNVHNHLCFITFFTRNP